MSSGRRGGADQYLVISGGAGNPLVLAGTVDPSAGGGVAAPEGSIYLRYVGAAGETWYKQGAANAAWVQIANVGNLVWTDDGTRIQPVNNARVIRMDNAGNARGSVAADFQQTRLAVTEVASGDRSFIAAGQNNTASGDDSHAMGSSCDAQAAHSQASGEWSLAEKRGYRAIANGQGGGTFTGPGDVQSFDCVIHDLGVAADLTLDGGAPVAANTLQVPAVAGFGAWLVEARVLMYNADVTPYACVLRACYDLTGQRGTLDKHVISRSANRDATMSWDGVLSRVAVTGTGASAQDKWTAHMRIVEVRLYSP
jgi:hypothetical protein